MYLNLDASHDYLNICEHSLEWNLISFEEFMQRLIYLEKLVDPMQYLSIKLNNRIEGYQNKFGKIVLDKKEEILMDEQSLKASSIEVIATSGKKSQEERFDLVTKTRGVISQWQFHKGDKDPFPSIPHGHSIKDKKYSNYKLDPFNGHIYDKKNFICNEKREFIKDLWNNDKFRKFALQSINHFKLNNPNFKFNKSMLIPEKK